MTKYDMRRFWLLTLAIVGTLALCPEAPAQNYESTPVTVSTDKVRRDGKVYYAHIVKEKQTLYSISKAYEVSIEDIYAANPGLEDTGLQKNAIILIPVAQSDTASSAYNRSDDEDDEEEMEEEEATEEETAVDKSSKKSKKTSKKDYFIHTVKWYENLDDISEKYAVPVEVIMDFNGLSDRKLTRKQQLKIPTKLDDYVMTQPTDSTVTEAVDTLAAEEAAVEVGEEVAAEPEKPRYARKDTVNALLMLPFNAKSSSPSQVSMDFYCGALIAARRLGLEGTNVDLRVYDTYGDVLPATDEELAEADFVIGPIATSGLAELVEKVPETTYVISPLDYHTTSLANYNSNFIQSSISQASQYGDLVQWIGEEKQPGDSVIAIYEKGVAGEAVMEEISQIMANYDYRWSKFSYNILQGRNILNSLSSQMSVEGMNRVIIASENEAFVNDVVRNLNLLIHSKYNITIYGGSKIRSFDTIDVENLHNANFHSSLSFHIDYNDARVMEFLKEYRALYNAEPSQTAFQGYDVMYYFASTCAKYGSDWATVLTVSNTPMLMSDFRFEKSGAGYVRTAVRRIVYEPDFSVRLVR